MPPKITWLVIVGADNELRAVAREALAKVFGEATVTEVAGLDEALRSPPTANAEAELILLADASLDEALRAVEAVDAAGLPRWGVIVFGAELAGEEMEILPTGEMSVDALAQSFKLAAQRRAWRRETARLRGDLVTLARRLSHELRTPLGCMLTTAELLKEVLAEQGPERAALTEPIIHSAHGMDHLIERVAFLAKASAVENAREKVAMGAIFWAARQRLEGQITRKKAAIAQPASWPDVQGTASWIEKVWVNLLANALQHGGAQIEAGWRQENSEVLFWLADNGAGVPPEKRAQLFQPFHSLHKTSAGRGFGLAIVQRLIERQGGRCGYEPRPEGGARFFFTLPVCDDAQRKS